MDMNGSTALVLTVMIVPTKKIRKEVKIDGFEASHNSFARYGCSF